MCNLLNYVSDCTLRDQTRRSAAAAKIEQIDPRGCYLFIYICIARANHDSYAAQGVFTLIRTNLFIFKERYLFNMSYFV